jgi:uncharacterized protein YukE
VNDTYPGDWRAVYAKAREDAAELDELRKTIREYADRFADDRREPDKILCHVQSLRRLAFSRTEPTKETP